MYSTATVELEVLCLQYIILKRANKELSSELVVPSDIIEIWYEKESQFDLVQ